MKVLIVLALAAVAQSQVLYSGIPQNFNYGYSAVAPIQYAAAPAVLAAAPVAIQGVTKTQYHAQDEEGRASWGHAEPAQTHNAFRDSAGNVRGSYAYIDPNGKENRVNYLADHNGFQVEANNLPQAPVHFAAQPLPIQDTPEVVAAKVAHFQAVAEATARSGRKRRQVAIASPLGYGYGVVGSNVVATHGLNHVAYSAGPVISNLGYSAISSPVVAQSYAAAPFAHTYAAAPVAVAPVQALREATLTKVVNTPGHAVSYRVD